MACHCFLLKNSINTLTRMMVKSARTKKFDDEIDLIFVNRGLESLGYIQVDSIIYMLIIVQSL